MPMIMAGALTQRGERPLGRYCPIERALSVISTRSAVLLLREAFYGATRFEEFTARTGLTDATAATHLRHLVTADIFDKRPYQEPGQRRRHEYVLTRRGADLMPALFALIQWGNDHEPPPYPPALRHNECGRKVTAVVRCAAGHLVTADEITVDPPGPFGLADPAPA